MGYTHYYYKHELVHDQKVWDKFLEDVQKVASKFQLCLPNSLNLITGDQSLLVGKTEHNIPIGDGMGDGETPEFTKDKIWFNGVGDDAHETLGIDRDSTYVLKDKSSTYSIDMWEKDKKIFDCTKTNYKPYDILVTATLALYQHHFGDKVSVSGDGGDEGFDAGIELVNKTLGYTLVAEELLPRNEEDE